MDTKIWYQSKVVWTQIFSILLGALTVLTITPEYKAIIMAVIMLVNTILTVAFRWDSSIPLGTKKK